MCRQGPAVAASWWLATSAVFGPLHLRLSPHHSFSYQTIQWKTLLTSALPLSANAEQEHSTTHDPVFRKVVLRSTLTPCGQACGPLLMGRGLLRDCAVPSAL